MTDETFARSLGRLAQAMSGARDDWWVIGSAAVALHGGEPGTIADIDVIVSRRDLDALYARLPLSNSPDDSKPMFRSELFGLWSEPPIAVEFMTGLDVRVGEEWFRIEPVTRTRVSHGDCEVFAPEIDELVTILEIFGREKDLDRAATLRKN